MQITDEMVDAAWVGWVNSIAANPLNIPSALRAALEAALGQFMLQYGDNVELQEAEQIGFNRSAACIEEIAAALKKTNARLYRLCKCDPESGCRDAALRAENSATLEKWGLK